MKAFRPLGVTSYPVLRTNEKSHSQKRKNYKFEKHCLSYNSKTVVFFSYRESLFPRPELPLQPSTPALPQLGQAAPSPAGLVSLLWTCCSQLPTGSHGNSNISVSSVLPSTGCFAHSTPHWGSRGFPCLCSLVLFISQPQFPSPLNSASKSPHSRTALASLTTSRPHQRYIFCPQCSIDSQCTLTWMTFSTLKKEKKDSTLSSLVSMTTVSRLA